ncbi:MAG TPA: hypothetical protein VMP00_00580 [Burkholderiales bacterium]|nr:hypothetical protein [Burkholderiales bacterium]
MDPIERYMLGLEGLHRQRGEMMHWLITALFPDVEQGLQYRMPTYKAGRDFVAWGFRGDSILLVTPSAQRIRAFRKRHPKIPAAGSTLSVRRSDPFPTDDLAKTVRCALAPQVAADKPVRPTARGLRGQKRGAR